MSDAKADAPVAVRAERGYGVRFALAYAGLAAALFALYCFPYAELGFSEAWFEAYLRGYAQVVGAVLSVFEPNLAVIDTSIVGRYSLRIAKNCDAMEIEILLVSALLALPWVPWRRRGLAALVAVVSVLVVNVLRICSLYYVGLYLPGQFERLHIEIWPLVLVAVAAFEFLVIARAIQRPASV